MISLPTPTPAPPSSQVPSPTPSALLAINPSETSMFLDKGWSLAGISLHREDTTGYRKRPPTVWRETLERARPEILLSAWSTPALPLDWLTDPACPLRYVCHLTGSVRNLVPRAFLERGGRVTNWGSLAAPQVAEHALLLALSALRVTSRWRVLTHENKLVITRTLFGKEVGIHGFGQVARQLIQLLRPFNVTVRVFAHGVPLDLIRSHGAEPCASLREMAARSEVFLDCEALTPESNGSVTAEVLGALPDEAVVVNVGRGRVIDEAALAAEARSGRLRVAIDVVANEPISQDSPLLAIPDLIYSPHLAGPTGDKLSQIGVQAQANIRRYVQGEPLQAEVTLEIYDRAT